MSPALKYFIDPRYAALGIAFSEPRLGDAGFDLRAGEELLVAPGEQVLVPTGLRLAIPLGWVGIVKDRSSMALKRIYTHAGVIDAGYRGEVKIVLSNHGVEPYPIEVGSKIAQLVIVPTLTTLVQVKDPGGLGETDRGSGGFGSTGLR